MTDPRLAAIADARFLTRRVFRIVDDEARRHGVDPLENQLLVQLLGAGARTRTVSELATRLDVPLNLVSRLSRNLEGRGLVERGESPKDARVTLVRATTVGARLTRKISNRARIRFASLHEDMSEERRRAALLIWAGNFGVELSVAPTPEQFSSA